MYPLDTFWVNCLKNLNVSSMYPLGKCPFAPSDRCLLLGHVIENKKMRKEKEKK